MDRDVYLILLGAGISLASSIVTLVLQFILGQWGERMRTNREGKEYQSRAIRAALVDKSVPTRVGPGGLLKRIEVNPDGLDLPSFMRNKRDGKPGSSSRSRYQLSIAVGILVFLLWIVWILVH